MTRPTLMLLCCLLLPSAPAAGQEEPARKDRFREARLVMLKGDAATAAELFRVIEKEEK